MFKLLSFKGDGAFWPMPERPDAPQAVTGVVGYLIAAPRRLTAAFAANLAARRTMRTLSSLDDRVLKDIGIARDQIWHVARHGRDAVMQSRDLRADFARW